IAEPDFGVLTNIGLAHIEGFKDIATVRKSKMELLDSVGLAAVNLDDEFLMEGVAVAVYQGRLLRFGLAEGADIRATDVEPGKRDQRETAFRLHMPDGEVPVKLGLTGMFNVYNALAAASATYMFGICAEDIKEGLESFKGVPMRMELKDMRGYTIISDVYNANPSSMEEAVKELIRLKKARAIAVLGDMLELGTYSETAHSRLGRWMADIGVDVFIAVGAEMRAAAREFSAAGKEAHVTDSAEEAGSIMRTMVHEDDTVLVKGSRSMRMEDVLESNNTHAANKEGGGGI
ncbi:hypothetical protein LCGC14_1647090, partial [marine sediment metagenome]